LSTLEFQSHKNAPSQFHLSHQRNFGMIKENVPLLAIVQS